MSVTTQIERTGAATRTGVGAWEREAWALIAEAEQHGVLLTERELIWYDVRDLQTLRRKLAAGQGHVFALAS